MGKHFAQDFHLSMYDAAPLFLNPAMTGLVETKERAHLQYRSQWGAVANKPFTTALASYDVSRGKWGFGGQICNQRAGTANYNVLQLLGSVAYAVALDKNNYHHLALGLQAGFNQKRLEYSALTFETQWTTANGGSFDHSLPSNEPIQAQSFFQEVVNFGALYYFGKQQTRFNPFLGFSAFNLTAPKDAFELGNSHLPRRYYAHAGIRINVTETFYLIPKALIYTQATVVQKTYALDAGYYFKGERFFALAGYTFRANDASVLYVGMKKDNYIIKIAYDFNTSGLRGVTKTRGAYELSFTWLGRKAKDGEVKNCPRL
jgi:type IX secretion system PorP/SprF family membrane protein